MAAPLLLLADPQVMFSGDWQHHLWMIGYYGEYFRQHGDMPTALNIAWAAGIAQPVFYGYMVYPLPGLVSAWCGASVALRIGVALLLLIQFGALNLAGNRIFRSRMIAYFVSLNLVVATYALTNLFNRGAIPEFFGAGFFVTSVAWAAVAAAEDAADRRIFFGWMAVVFFVLALGSHPPTAVLAGATAAVLGGAAAAGLVWDRAKVRRALALAAAGAAAWGALVLAPWVYAALKLGSQLSVAGTSGSFQFLPERSDSFWGRFSPFPYDRLGLEMGIYDVGAPYLEAPVSVALLVFLTWNLLRLRGQRRRKPDRMAAGGGRALRWVSAAAAGWFVALAGVSISPALADFFQFAGPPIQYVYRLVSYCNVALLVAVFASGALLARAGGYGRHRYTTGLVLTACLTITVLGVWVKLQHASVAGLVVEAPQFETGGDRARLVTEGQGELAGAYATPPLRRELTATEQRGLARAMFPVGRSGENFGRPKPLRIAPVKQGWVVTNAVNFPWQEVTVDGRPVAPGDTAHIGQFVAVRVAGDARELQAVWRPDPQWWILHRGSQVGLVLGLVFTAGWATWRGLKRGRDARSVS